MPDQSETELRILVVAPTGRDARLIAETLTTTGMSAIAMRESNGLVALLEEGAGSLIVAEEALSPRALEEISKWLASQPPWSDLPIVVLTLSGRPNASNTLRARELEVLGNLTILERPVRPETLRTSTRAALRARLRQYQMRQRQETLTRVNADLEQFAHSASHDLQEPLRNLAIYSELLSRRYSDVLDENGKEFLGYLKAGASQMEALVRDLLAYTQAASISEEAPDPIDVTKALEAALANLKESIRKSNSRVLYGPLPAVRMREVHLQQLFQNLVGNAIKYRGECQPEVNISAIESNGEWIFAIKDNGIGIPAEFNERIFGIFKRLHSSEKYEGTGIGLAICKRIAERYRGKIWVESELGRGSTFYFSVSG